MRNKDMLKKMSVKCAAAILAAGLMMSSAGNMVGGGRSLFCSGLCE